MPLVSADARVLATLAPNTDSMETRRAREPSFEVRGRDDLGAASTDV